MTEQQARDFLDELSRSKDPRIRNFIKELERKMAQTLFRKGGGFICRKLPIVAEGLFAYDAYQHDISYATNELLWPASELWADEECGCEAD